MAQKLDNIYRIKPRFRRSSRIDADLSRSGTLDGYGLNDSAWEALRQVFAQYGASQQRAFTWTGPYGAGKSSLALFLASLLSSSAKACCRQAAFPFIGNIALV